VNRILYTTPRLKIRNLAESDLEAFHQYRSNPDVTRYQGFDTFSLKQAKEFIDNNKKKINIQPGEWIQFGIENTNSCQLIGDCAIYLHLSDPRIAETGITISHLHQRMGYAKETMLGMMNYLFLEKGIHRLVEVVDIENQAPIAMLKSLSFRLEGQFLESTFLKGKWTSEFVFAMLKKEWNPPVFPKS
jgi:[ribosomal protein S5]-alanine N-acetyltransferase